MDGTGQCLSMNFISLVSIKSTLSFIDDVIRNFKKTMILSPFFFRW